MRPFFLAIVLSVGAVQVLAGQQRSPAPRLYRGPSYATRVAKPIEPARGMPVELSAGTYSLSGLGRAASITTTITSRTLRPIPVSGITLRAAYGPLSDGIVTFRLRPSLRTEPEDFRRILPDRIPRTLQFVLVDEDPTPGIISMMATMQVVYTVERIESEEGPLIYENPDATELLWEALGRPTFSSQ